MAGLTTVSNYGAVAYGFNYNGMFKGCPTEDGFIGLLSESHIPLAKRIRESSSSLSLLLNKF
ncbi:putative isoaspartyl peptidase/L-asparaginase 2, partial [Mucuna pruriens]